MSIGLGEVTNLVDTVGKHADELFESGEERQKALTERHNTDMMSDSWLSKNVRPIAFIFSLVCQ